MSYTRTSSEAALVFSPTVVAPGAALASVIWLHGLGADGNDFAPIIPELRLPDSLQVRFIFPNAPQRPVTLNNGYVMRAWYDIIQLGGNGPEDAQGIRASQHTINQLIAAERAVGVPSQRMVIAGFSQGGAIALQTALRYPEPLAGVMPLSTYLPLRDSLANEASAANRELPILMCHGRQDPVVPYAMGERSRELLQSLGYRVDFRTYTMPHSVCAEQIKDISAWLQQVLR